MGVPFLRLHMAQTSSDVERRAGDEGWATLKGEFRGYSKNSIGDRAVKQGKRRAWGQSRKNKSKKTANRYKRSKVRGSGSGARPKMRRQLGAGGKRVSRSR